MNNQPGNQASATRRFLRNPLSMAGLAVILMAVVIALLGYLILPDQSPHANRQHIEIAARKPGFRVRMLKVRKNEQIDQHSLFGRIIHGQRDRYRYYPCLDVEVRGDSLRIRDFSDIPGDPPTYRSFHLADVVYPLDPSGKRIEVQDGMISFRDVGGNDIRVSREELREQIEHHQIITRTYRLGTDRFGRDFLSRLLLGTRVSFSVGFIAVGISLLIGLLLGSVAGYFRGRTDDLIMWFINIVWSIPTLLMVIAITLALGRGFWQVFVAVGLTMWVEVARIVRGQVMGLREKEFIQAARTLGFGHARILLRHILPNVINPVIIVSAANFASAILLEAGLSFLGIGVQPPVPSWGTMIRDHYGFIIVDKAYLAFLPGLAIMMLVLAFTLMGNGLRDALDVQRE